MSESAPKVAGRGVQAYVLVPGGPARVTPRRTNGSTGSLPAVSPPDPAAPKSPPPPQRRRETQFVYRNRIARLEATKAAVKSAVETIHWLDGLEGIVARRRGFDAALRAAGTSPDNSAIYREVQRLWTEAAQAHSRVVQGWFEAIDARANFRARQVVEQSQLQVAATAKLYFGGLTDQSFSDDGIDFADATLLLAETSQTKRLQAALKSLRPSAAAVADAWKQMHKSPYGVGPSGPYTEALVLHQVAVADRAAHDPTLVWVLGEIDAKDRADRIALLAKDTDELEPELHNVLGRAWRSGVAVQKGLDRLPAMVPGSEEWPEERVASAIRDGETAGVWRYPRMVQRAMQELGYGAPSAQEATVRRAYGKAGRDWNRVFQVSGAQIACGVAAHAIAAPLAAVVDVLFAGFAVYAAYADYKLGLDDHYAVFDPKNSLSAPPDAWKIAGELVGAVFAPASTLRISLAGSALAMGVGSAGDGGVPRWQP